MRQALDEPAAQRIVHDRHDDGDRLRRALGRLASCGTHGHEDVDLRSNELGRELRVAIVLAFRPAAIDDDVLAFHIALLAQALAERAESSHSRWIRRTARRY